MALPIKVNHSAIYFTGLVIIVSSLPYSNFSLSVGQFVVLGNWLLEGNFKKKYQELISNKAGLVLISFYVMHVLGLIYTTDINYALKDLRVKLPLLALPIIFTTTHPLSQKKFDLVLGFFISAAFVATLIGYGILFFKEINEVREMSPFISHIRLSLIISISIFFTGYFAFEKYKDHLKIKVALALLIVWFFAYLIFSESATGTYTVIVVSFILVVLGIIRIKNYRIRISVISISLLIPIAFGTYLYYTANAYLIPHKNDLKNLKKYTALGNLYTHDTLPYTVENGSYYGLYICETELREAWNKRSKLNFDGPDEKGQELKFTLIRYLNSLDLTKDVQGIAKLNAQDIRNIELGIANYNYAKKFDPNNRIYKFLWEYQALRKGDNPKGLSMIQRLEYWKAAIGIIREHFWIGVGTGDMDDAFRIQYEKMKTELPLELRHRSHNQFLAIFTAFGLIGLLWFLFTLLYPPLYLKAFRSFLYFSFFMVIVLSMVFEDTIETQIGATLFAFFNALLLFARKENPPEYRSRRKL